LFKLQIGDGCRIFIRMLFSILADADFPDTEALKIYKITSPLFFSKRNCNDSLNDEGGGLDVKELYAHSANSQGQRHRLDNHLKSTAERAADMAKEFGCSRWGWLAGLWHDLVNIPKTFRK